MLRPLLAPGIRFNDCLFTEPVRSAELVAAPGCGGIVAVLVRNPNWAPKPFQPLYFGEFGNDAHHSVFPAGLPAAVNGNEVFISLLPMPFSTSAQRRKFRNELIAAYNPVFQAHSANTQIAELSSRIDNLEMRQQEQNAQILSLLSHITRMFEPLPAAPRRPIGFLPQLAPVGPVPATETGS